LDFAKRLRAKGIDVWLDKWEMSPGDSLVDKIFSEGIKDASAFIVVLSSNSVAKPWVRQEINAAFVKRIDGKCKLIPVILDACDVPECLRTTLWEPIADPASYDDSLQRVVNAVFGLQEKPPIGAPPSHAGILSALSLTGMTKTDALVFQALCESTIASGNPMASIDALDELSNAGITDAELRDSLNVLDEQSLLELGKVLGGGYRGTSVHHARVSTSGFDDFAQVRWPNYSQVLTNLVAAIVNGTATQKPEFDAICQNERLADHLIRVLENQGLVRVARYFGGYQVHSVSPQLKRSLGN
jgi:hypothetical protein